MSSTFWIIVIVGLIAVVWWYGGDEGSDGGDDVGEPYKPCPEYGCPSAKSSDKSVPPRGNVVLNEFYYPYSGAQYFEHDANDVTIQPGGPAFMSGDVNTSGGVENMSAGLHNQPAQTPLSGRGTGGGQTLTAKSEPDHVPMS